MIPVRLELCNFLSYTGPIEIDFTSFDVACLSGDNGAGKSALLDALTFAVWGCARGCEGGINQERLIRDGAEEMYVDFTFELQDETFRIVRRRSAGKGGEVHFLVADGERWRNRAEGTLRETDAQIEATLRMNYETFTASALFIQGRTDDFLRMAPSGRREVFAQLLDLGTYDKLAEAAKTRAKEAEARRSEQASIVEKLRGSRDDLAGVTAQLAAAEAQAREAKAAEDDAKQRSTEALAELSELEKADAVLADQRAQLEIDRTATEELAATIDAKRRAIHEVAALLARADEVEAALAEAVDLRTNDEAMRAAERAAAELARRRTEIAGRIEGERKALVAERTALEKRSEQLEAETASHALLAAELGASEKAIEDAGDPRQAVEEAQAQIATLDADAARLDEQIRATELRTTEIADKIALLAGGGGECPVCGTALDTAHRTKVKRSLETEGKTLKRERDAARSERETVTKEAKRWTEDLKRLRKTLADHDAVVAQAVALRGRLASSDDAVTELEQVRAALARMTELLSEDSFASELLSQLVSISSEIASVYDRDAHAAVRGRLAELQPYEELAGRLAAARQQETALAEELNDLDAKVAAYWNDLAARGERIAVLEQQTARIDETRVVSEAAAAQAAGASETALRAAQTAATLAERLEATSRLVADLTAAEAADEATALERRRYQRLAEAFGRNGIPQRIIENERPFLEDETNRILGRLSDEPMAVHLRFQGRTKSGKDRETLEILVRPLDGEPRDFAMFSGGEAFRIAFAVRLAMSKLLVRRAGARLETLVIDEGFGTQDPEGRERLVEAINLARTEFKKVLIITHLDDLKDQFGTQILVSKGRGGSIVEIAGS